MKKRFDIWNNIKKWIHDLPGVLLPAERDIWYVHLGENVGFEQDGKGDQKVSSILLS